MLNGDIWLLELISQRKAYKNIPSDSWYKTQIRKVRVEKIFDINE